MSFDSAQLSVLAYANGFTQWHYRSTDPLARILALGYFADAAAMLRPGDHIIINVMHSRAVGLAQGVIAHIANDNQPSLTLLAATPNLMPPDLIADRVAA